MYIHVRTIFKIKNTYIYINVHLRIYPLALIIWTNCFDFAGVQWIFNQFGEYSPMVVMAAVSQYLSLFHGSK